MKTYCLENNIGQQESINRERESERKVDVLTNETIGKTGSVTTSK